MPSTRWSSNPSCIEWGNDYYTLGQPHREAPLSVRVMSLIWEHAPVSEGELLVLLAIADHAADDGTNAWPSKATLARKARLSERRVQQILRSLEDKGLIRVETQKGGTLEMDNRLRPNRYTIVVSALKTGSVPSGEKPIAPLDVVVDDLHLVVSPDPAGENFGAVRGEVWSTLGEKPISPKPSLEPSIEPSINTSSANAEAIEVFKPISAQTIVAAYIDRWKELHNEPCLARQQGQLARAAREMLNQGCDPDRLIAAAEKCAADGHARLDSAYAWITANPTRATGNAGGGRREASLRQGLELAARYAEHESETTEPRREITA